MPENLIIDQCIKAWDEKGEKESKSQSPAAGKEETE
jgi:hypothetical protein